MPPSSLEYRETLPHAVYSVYNRKMELLYIGCSPQIFSRFAGRSHGNTPWLQEIAAIKVVWYPDRITGRRAEAAEILNRKPKYNKRTVYPDDVGMAGMRTSLARPRGDGLHCPKCGSEKRRRADAYCMACYRVYSRERYRRRQQAKSRVP